jgi:hypothetical protein
MSRSSLICASIILTLFATCARAQDDAPPPGAGNLKVATSLGKIIRDHGLDVRAGATIVADCANVTETECFAIKRIGKVLDAKIDTTSVACDVNCVLVLASGVHRTLPADAKVVIGPTHIANRLAPNVSAEHQVGLQTQFSNQFRLYLSQMGVSTEIVDIIDRDTHIGRPTQLSSKDWLRLGLVTAP